MNAVHSPQTLHAALRANIPPVFQFQPVIEAVAAPESMQALHIARLGDRIEALQASLRHELSKNDRQCELMKQAAETISSLRARLTAKMPDYIDVVQTVFIDGDEFLCGFITDNGSLHLEKMFAIGAVDVGSFDSDCMARMAKREAERQIEGERGDAAYNQGADRHEFNLAFGG